MIIFPWYSPGIPLVLPVPSWDLPINRLISWGTYNFLGLFQVFPR